MKQLFTIIAIIFTLSITAQKLQVTSMVNIDAQWAQLVKTNDSLKVVVINYKTLVTRYKQDSINYKNWVSVKNQQMWAKMDSIKVLKTQLFNCTQKQYLDSIQFIGFTDTIAGTYTKITEKEWSVVPKFSWQIVKRYPIKIGTATKTKEVTITELKQ